MVQILFPEIRLHRVIVVVQAQIQKIKQDNPTWGYKKIAKAVGCSPSSVKYHLQPHTQIATRQRAKIYRITHRHSIPLILRRKIAQFMVRAKQTGGNGKTYKRTNNNTLTTFDEQALLAKIGESPTCYLSGAKIDLSDSRSYELDHIQPSSKNGPSSIENCGLTSRQANRAKHSLSIDEFLDLCQKILETHGFHVTKKLDALL